MEANHRIEDLVPKIRQVMNKTIEALYEQEYYLTGYQPKLDVGDPEIRPGVYQIGLQFTIAHRSDALEPEE